MLVGPPKCQRSFHRERDYVGAIGGRIRLCSTVTSVSERPYEPAGAAVAVLKMESPKQYSGTFNAS